MRVTKTAFLITLKCYKSTVFNCQRRLSRAFLQSATWKNLLIRPIEALWCSDETGVGDSIVTRRCKSLNSGISIFRCVYVCVCVCVLMTLTLSSPVVIICTIKCNMQQLYVLPTQCIFVFCMDLKTDSDYLPIQH